jgi:dipeptidyl aminopeptidase/acylaminoacyl peptidase
VRPLTVAAADGVEHDALLHVDWGAAEERARASGRRTAVVHLHGNQGNMTVGALRFLPEPLAAAGFPLLSVTTRIGNVSQLFGEAVFEDALLDVAAAVGCLADHGFDHVVVSGYSLGAVLAVRAAAGPLPLPLRGLVTLGCAWSLPESTRARMAAGGATPAYADLARDLAWAGSDPGRADEALVIRRLYGPRDEPRFCGVYTARTWWHSRGPEAVDAMSHRHIGACPAPVLLVQGDGDVIVDPPDAARLAEAARAAGNPDVTVAMIPGTGHPFQGAHEQVVGAVGGWLATRA